LDAYDLSFHLRDNSYCVSTTTVSAFAAAAHPSSNLGDSISSGDDISSRPEEGDSFMYGDDPSLDTNNVAHLGQPKIGSDSSRSSAASSSTPGDATSVSSASSHHDDSELSAILVSDESDSSGSESSPNEYEFIEETSFPTCVDDVVHVGLVDLCRRIKAPLYAYNEILHWAQDAKVQGYSFPLEAPHYSTFMSNLKKRLNVEDYVHKTVTVQAGGGGTVSFPVFDFESMFLSLIDDPHIKEHLLINWEAPSLPPPFQVGNLDEIHSGMWHERTSAKLVSPNSNDVLSGIILAIDRTHVADKDKLSLEPVLFSLSIIPRALRNQPFAWRPLGFIPKMSRSQSLGSSHRTYHRVLGRMLSGLVFAQNHGGINCSVLHGPVEDVTEVDLCFKVPLAFVIGDVEGHDVLCAQYHTHNTTMLSRECNCSLADADNHQVHCQYIRASDLTQLRESGNLTALNGMCSTMW
jgi:hypothetical protein